MWVLFMVGEGEGGGGGEGGLWVGLGVGCLLWVVGILKVNTG